MSYSTSRRALLPALAAAVLMSLMLAAPASGEDGRTVLQASMTGNQEATATPPCAPPAVCGDPDGTGLAFVGIDTDADTLCYTLTVQNIDPATAAHIHEAPPGVPGPVVVPLSAPASGTSSGCVDDVDPALLADIAANPGDYYVNVHNQAFPGGAVRGQLGVAQLGQVMVMKHLCDEDIQTAEDFAAVEAREQTNTTTPDSPFGSTVETVLACPTIVQPGDPQSGGAIAGGERAFEFTAADPAGPQTLTADAAFSGPAKLCETDVDYDADRDGNLEASVCLDISHYIFETLEGAVTVTETTPPAGTRFGALRFTPLTDDPATLLSSGGGVIQLDTARDEDTAVMLHVYNFVNVAATAAPTRTAVPNTSTDERPAVGVLPVVAVSAGVLLGSVAAMGAAVVLRRRPMR